MEEQSECYGKSLFEAILPELMFLRQVEAFLSNRPVNQKTSFVTDKESCRSPMKDNRKWDRKGAN